ncbi:UDP-glycosyltransferase 87A2-like isoform X1 [Solanum stenotomum]|uniref:UDP-glycosyltransferase 87A2-like isoform X1 n=1 Tax=Solanum stenotomum TaxID=172797 RepID=UPI0020CFF04D|nr:UDP-glycosyltransferase 87A2-like isoform X1 [Solanum stenotomum]
METTSVDLALFSCHILAIPYPGRGHINPLMNLCKLIATTSKPNHLLQISFIVTEEWFSFLKSEPKPDNIQFQTIPNVIPSEKDRSKDLLGFVEAVYTKMKAPIDSILDGLPKPNMILADSLLPWAVGIGERRNIPVASFWTMSATVFSILHHHQLLLANGHFEANLAEQGEELVSYIPGITPICVKDLPPVFHCKYREMLHLILEVMSQLVNKAQYALFTTIEPLETQVIEALQAEIPVPIFTVGPTIPYLDTEFKTNQPCPNYLSWLDDQPKDSVLYISQGSFLSVSNTQLDEIIAGVHSSGVRTFWVARETSSLLITDGIGKRGIVVPWCDQLRVLCHPSVGGFWSHCGWNSTKEGAFAGVPFLTFPIVADQFTNSKQIVEDWKIGWRVNKESENLVKRDEIALLVQSFMDLDSYHGREMRKRAMGIRKIFQEAIEGGAIQANIYKFIQDISQGPRQ